MSLLEKKYTSEQKVLFLVYAFVFLAFLSDIPIIVFFTLTKSVALTKYLLYALEFIILLIPVYLIIKQSNIKLPVPIFLFGFYVFAIAILSIFFFNSYDVFRSSRKFFALLTPIIIGYYFGYYYIQQRETYIKKLIMFLTVMSVIGFIEWLWWGLSHSSIIAFYSNCFDISSYYHYVRHSSNLTETGIMASGIRPTGIIISSISKRLTGLYYEPFAAGFNSGLAVILLLYCRIAGYKKIKWEYVLFAINIIAVILTTSRSAYLLLSIFLLVFFIIKGKLHPAMFLCFLTLLYEPFRKFCIESIRSLGGESHQEAAMGLPSFIWSHIGQVEFIWGGGLGSLQNGIFLDESGYGAIFVYLGMIGLIAFAFFYLSLTMKSLSSIQDKYFSLGLLISTFVLMFFAGYPFGYKTYGFFHLFLGMSLSNSMHYSSIYIQRDNLPIANLAFSKNI